MQEVSSYYTMEGIAASRRGARSTDRVGLCRASLPNSASKHRPIRTVSFGAPVPAPIRHRNSATEPGGTLPPVE